VSEHRGKRHTKDPGARTRRTDHAESPHAFPEWMTTFHLRWAEHAYQERSRPRPQPA